ncbi:hypothetical protein K490DRAFT_18819, partial [Saccharata proteae CBS 121410]
PPFSRFCPLTEASYELPHRANVAKIYPIPAPNGSTVVVYGHSDGLRILWRGGRPLKPSNHAGDGKQQVNGTSSDAVMIDLTEDEPVETAAPTSEEESEYETEEEEEESAPYPPVVQHLDMPLGAEVLHLAFPHIPPVSSLRPADSIPGIFTKRIVLSVACADCSVRIITLPLAPFHDALKAIRSAQVLRIEGQHGHQSIPTGLAMAWTSRDPSTFESTEDMEDSDDDGDARMIRSFAQNQTGLREWDIVIASHSVELTGLLHIFRIPILMGENQWSLSKDPIFPYQTQHLPSPAVQVTFSPAQHPNRRHLQLLVADMKGSVKVYDPLAPSKVRPRSSHSTRDSETKLGAWIASFATRYEMSKDSTSGLPGLAQRKRVLDVQWASEGGSIIALLSDGEWGVWDVDGLNPGKTTNKSTSKFAIGGFVNTASSSSIAPRQTGTNRSMALAPMTPNTRRTKEESLFHGSPENPTGISRGGISVASSLNHSGSRMEDSIIIWYNENIYRIPNLQAYWNRGAASLSGPGIISIEGVSLYGELCNGVEQFAQKSHAARMGVPRDLLITGEHRFIVLSSTPTQATGGLFSNLNPIDDLETSRIDQTLLDSGELDLGGVDRLIDSMEQS